MEKDAELGGRQVYQTQVIYIHLSIGPHGLSNQIPLKKNGQGIPNLDVHVKGAQQILRTVTGPRAIFF